jgi:hypothetical protein
MTVQAGQPKCGCVTLLLPAALLPVRLRNPVADRLRRRFELTGKVGRIATGPDQIHHLTAEAVPMDGLPGYSEYAAKVRFCLLPGVW